MTTLRTAAQQALEAICSCGPQQREAAAALRAALAEQPAGQEEPVAQRWQPIETAPKGRIVLVYYKNSLGNGRTMRARYYLPETLDSDTTESGWADEGWYEESEAYEYLMPLEHDPTHWMPLPAGPDTAPQPAIPPGYKLVPVEPTPKMRKAAADAWIDCGGRLILNKAAAALRAGIAAAPTPPAQRVMLTDEEVTEVAYAQHNYPKGTVGSAMFRKGVRYAEAAHGITKE